MVCTVSYWSCFFSQWFLTCMLCSWAVNQGEKNLVHSLQYRPRTQLVRGNYFTYVLIVSDSTKTQRKEWVTFKRTDFLGWRLMMLQSFCTQMRDWTRYFVVNQWVSNPATCHYGMVGLTWLVSGRDVAMCSQEYWELMLLFTSYYSLFLKTREGTEPLINC